MENSILNFNKQFGWIPEIKNAEKLKPAKSFVVSGMGGSHLAADIYKAANPFADVYVHRDYGLPPLSEEELHESLLIASSYSGNTEEVLDFAETAYRNKLNLICIAVGGKLLEFAKTNSLPYIQLPDDGIQPRMAIGYSILALAAAVKNVEMLAFLEGLQGVLNPESMRKAGEELADSLKGKIPVIYSSAQNETIAYNWKIKFNETGKIPAFYNVFPELNHNEMTGFDAAESTKDLSDKFHFIFLASENDHTRVKIRMKVCEKMYQDRGLPVTTLWLSGETVLEKILNSLLLADWTALHLSKIYGTEAEQVPMVEEFKKAIEK